jgi:hypothetical protein
VHDADHGRDAAGGIALRGQMEYRVGQVVARQAYPRGQRHARLHDLPRGLDQDGNCRVADCRVEGVRTGRDDEHLGQRRVHVEGTQVRRQPEDTTRQLIQSWRKPFAHDTVGWHVRRMRGECVRSIPPL